MLDDDDDDDDDMTRLLYVYDMMTILYVYDMMRQLCETCTNTAEIHRGKNNTGNKINSSSAGWRIAAALSYQ